MHEIPFFDASLKGAKASHHHMMSGTVNNDSSKASYLELAAIFDQCDFGSAKLQPTQSGQYPADITNRACLTTVARPPLPVNREFTVESAKVIIDNHRKRLNDPHFVPTRKTKINAYVELNDIETAALLKVGPQGRTPDYKEVVPLISRYFAKAKYKGHNMSRIMKRAVDYVQRQFATGKPIPRPELRFESTDYALPVGGKKNSPKNIQRATDISYRIKPYVVQECITGTRDMKQGIRMIYPDSGDNWAYMSRIMRHIQDYLKLNFPEFCKWLNPDYYQDVVVPQFIQSPFTSIEADYEKMDTTFTWDIVADIVLPVLKDLPIWEGDNEYQSFCDWAEGLFSHSLYLGTARIVGLHAMFSGILPTNPFETIFSYVKEVAVMLELELLREQKILLFCGDDQAAIYRGIKSEGFVSRYKDMQMEICDSVGMKLHPDKYRVSNDTVYFCKELYTPFLKGINVNGKVVKRPIYASTFVVNSLIYPERTPATNRCQYIMAQLQRLNNLRSSPYKGEVISDWLDAIIANDSSLVDVILNHDALANTVLEMDWWSKVYDSSFTIHQSVVYEAIRSSLLNKLR